MNVVVFQFLREEQLVHLDRLEHFEYLTALKEGLHLKAINKILINKS
jgi:hypothetical protein